MTAPQLDRSNIVAFIADIFERRCLPEHPSIYLSRPTATDPSLAPAGTQLLYILVPSPTLESGIDWRAEMPGFRKRVFDRLSRVGLDNLDERLSQNRVQEHLTNQWLDYLLTQHKVARV